MAAEAVGFNHEKGREMKEESVFWCWIAVMITIALSLSPAIWVFRSSMEAKTYNEITEKHVTTWQAMWVEFRVQEGAK